MANLNYTLSSASHHHYQTAQKIHKRRRRTKSIIIMISVIIIIIHRHLFSFCPLVALLCPRVATCSIHRWMDGWTEAAMTLIICKYTVVVLR